MSAKGEYTKRRGHATRNGVIAVVAVVATALVVYQTIEFKGEKSQPEPIVAPALVAENEIRAERRFKLARGGVLLDMG